MCLKVRYRVRGEAKRALRLMYAHGIKDKDLRVYRCIRCGDYHIGHQAGLPRHAHREMALRKVGG